MLVNNLTQLDSKLCTLLDKYTNSQLYGICYPAEDWNYLISRRHMIVDYDFNIYEDGSCKPQNTLTCDCDDCYLQALQFNNEFSEVTIGINRISILNQENGTSIQIINDGSKVDGADPETNSDFRYVDTISLLDSNNVKHPLLKVVYHTLGSVKTYEWLDTTIVSADKSLIEAAITFNTVAKGLIYDKRVIDSVLKGYDFNVNSDYTTPYSTSSGTNYIELTESSLTYDVNNEKEQEGLRWSIDCTGTVLNTTDTIVANTNTIVVNLFIKRLKAITVGVTSNTYSSPFAADEARLSYTLRDIYEDVSIPTGSSNLWTTGSDWWYNDGTSQVLIGGNLVNFTGPSQSVSQSGLGAGDIITTAFLQPENQDLFCYQTAIVELPSVQFEPGVAGNPTVSLEIDGITIDDFNDLRFISIIQENNTQSVRTYTNLISEVFDSSNNLLYTDTVANPTAGSFNRNTYKILNPNKDDFYTIRIRCTVDGSITIGCQLKVIIPETY